MTIAANNTFRTTRELFGKKEVYIEAAKFASRLCIALDGKDLKTEPGHYGRGEFVVGDLKLVCRTDRDDRVTVHARAVTELRDRHRTPKFPSATVSTNRPWDNIVADVRRRIIVGSGEALNEFNAVKAKQNDMASKIDKAIESCAARYPSIEAVRSSDGLSASLRAYTDDFSFDGTIFANGEISVQSIRPLNASASARLLDACFGK